MAKAKTKYRQCRLVKKTETGQTETVSYLPAEFAKVGWTLALKDPDSKEWSDGWAVQSIGELVDEPPNWRQLIRGHRKMTGDDMPKLSV